MKTVLIINPKTVNKYYHISGGWVDRQFAHFIQRAYDKRFFLPTHSRCATMPPVTLFALEALFAQRCRTLVVDEQVESIDFDVEADLVCLTATTPQYERARAVAAAFRSRGIHTAVGGIHATCLPEECAADFDTVCVGEAEGYLDRLLADLDAGSLQKVYKTEAPVDPDALPFYRYDLASTRYLPFYVVSFSRGCKFNCEFCSVRATVGPHRTRSVATVVRSIAESGAKKVWFADAALTADRAKALELFRALAPLGVEWVGAVPLDVGRDEEMLDAMAESGCWLASVGFETLSAENLRSARKTQNRAEDYPQVISAFHQRRIAIEGNFVFGFDGDDVDVFERTARFTIDHGIDLPEFYVLTPYPGTALYRRLLQEGRIVDRDWSHYDNTHFRYLPVFEPAKMTRQELLAGCRRAERIAYSRTNTVRRLSNTGMMRAPIWIVNYVFARRLRRSGNLLPLREEQRVA